MRRSLGEKEYLSPQWKREWRGVAVQMASTHPGVSAPTMASRYNNCDDASGLPLRRRITLSIPQFTMMTGCGPTVDGSSAESRQIEFD